MKRKTKRLTAAYGAAAMVALPATLSTPELQPMSSAKSPEMCSVRKLTRGTGDVPPPSPQSALAAQEPLKASTQEPPFSESDSIPDGTEPSTEILTGQEIEPVSVVSTPSLAVPAISSSEPQMGETRVVDGQK